MTRRAERIEDEVLILEYRAGDIGSLGKLITRWQRRVYYFVLTVVEDRTAAWDVSQEVWLSAISGLSKLRRVKSFSAWLYRMAHNKAISYLRKKGRLVRQEQGLPEPVGEHAIHGEERLCAKEDARLVHECLEQLPLAQRECLGLFYLDDLSLDEIARVLGVPLGTVQSRLHYGRIKMKELLLRKGYSNGDQ